MFLIIFISFSNNYHTLEFYFMFNIKLENLTTRLSKSKLRYIQNDCVDRGQLLNQCSYCNFYL